jgi:hypothetical protein
MTKKKKNSSSPHVIKADEKKLIERFLGRITYIGEALVGEQNFELIPRQMFQAITPFRTPALKAKAAPGSDILKSTVVQYNKLLTEFVAEHAVTTDLGEKIPLTWYLSDGVILLHYIANMSNTHFPKAMLVKEAFKKYLPGSEHYIGIGQLLETIILDVNIFLSELDRFIIHADMTATAYEDGYTSSNAIFIKRFRPDSKKILAGDHYRTAIKVGWILADETWHYVSVRPAQIGFAGEGAEVSLPVYVQQHAIAKLQERIDITPGILHYGVGVTFMDEDIPHVIANNHSLVEYVLSEQRVGYFLCKWCDDCILISTFLFLTMDGTPEGRKLKELSLLQRADMAYLGIDTLPNFNSYHFEKDESLTKLFTAAGCDSLLRLGHLEEFSKKSIADKDPESIKKYLSDFDVQNKWKG